MAVERNKGSRPDMNPPNLPIITHPINGNRGAWFRGTERPELLITETLAFHDRRTEDRYSPDTNGHNDFASFSSGHYFDKDLDQSLRPRVAVCRALQSELG